MTISVSLLAAGLVGFAPSQPQLDGAVELAPSAAPTWLDVAAPPQDPDPVAPAARFDFASDDEFLFFSESEGVLWVRGETYKASAGADGFTYYPFLGSDAPGLSPVHFELGSATLDGRALHLTDEASLRVDGTRAVLDRGSVHVRYDYATDSVEQSFVVDAAGARGDLVLELDVTTGMTSEVEGRGFRFDGARGGVRYGGAIVLDGTGRRADVPARLEGGHLTLTVPAAFLESAQGAIVVDPILSTWTVGDISRNLLEPDVAYASAPNQFVYVVEDQFAVGDTDIFLRQTNLTGSLIDQSYVNITPLDCLDPEVAYHNGVDVVLVAYTVVDGTGDSAIRGRIWDTLGLVFNSAEIVIGEVAPNWPVNRDCDVGGNGTTNTNGAFMVAWIREFTGGEVHARFRAVSTTGVIGTLQGQIGNTLVDKQVAVSKSVGVGSIDHWNAAFIQEDTTTGDESIIGVQFQSDGTVRSPFDSLFTLPAGDAAVDIDVSESINVRDADPAYIITYDEVGPGDEDVWVHVCRDNVSLGRFDLALHEGDEADRNQLEPRVSTVRDHFVVSHLAQRDTGINFDVVVSVFDLVAGALPANMESRVVVGDTGALWSGGLAMASRFSGGLTTSSFIGLGWSQFGTDGTGGSSWNVDGALFTADAPRAVGVQYCYGVPNSTGERGYMQVFGDTSTTATKELVATNLPPNAVGYFALGSLPANVPNAGGSVGTLCIGGTVGRYAGNIINSGPDGEIRLVIDPTALPTPTGTVPAMAGTARGFQLWHRDSDNGMATSNFTNAATVPFI